MTLHLDVVGDTVRIVAAGAEIGCSFAGGHHHNHLK